MVHSKLSMWSAAFLIQSNHDRRQKYQQQLGQHSMAMLHFLHPSKSSWIYYQQQPTSPSSMSLLFLLSTPVKPPVPSLQRHVSVKPQTLGELFDTPDVCAAMQRNVGRLEHWTHRNHMKFNEMYGQKPHSETVHKSGVFSRCLLPLTKVSFFSSVLYRYHQTFYPYLWDQELSRGKPQLSI